MMKSKIGKSKMAETKDQKNSKGDIQSAIKKSPKEDGAHKKPREQVYDEKQKQIKEGKKVGKGNYPTVSW